MLNTGNVAALLERPLGADANALSYVLLTPAGTVLVSRVAKRATVPDDDFPIDMVVHDRVYALLAAKAWAEQRAAATWVGLALPTVKLAVFPAGNLLLLAVTLPQAPWGFVELLGTRTAKALADGLGDFSVPE